MNIKCIYNNIIKSRSKWNYYHNGNIIFKSCASFKDSELCYRFICDYLKISEKGSYELREGLEELHNEDTDRLCHICSVFFLGLSLFYNENLDIRRPIMKKLYEGININEDEFVFVWFLIAIFHDLGYKNESMNTPVLLDLNNLNGIFSSRDLAVPSFYKDIIQPYYENLRKNKDHGIYEGVNLLGRLISNRKNHEKTGSNLCWNDFLDKVYRYVSQVILVHNIWFKRRGEDKESDINEYLEKGLDVLVLSSDKTSDGIYTQYPIKFDEYPILFLLLFVDSIDPIKKGLWGQDISIEISRNQISFRSTSKAYIDNVYKLNSWLVNVSREDFNATLKLE